MDKSYKRKLLKQFKQNERDALLSSVPLPMAQLNELFDYLDKEFKNDACDHTLKKTKVFLSGQGLPEGEIIDWLNSLGAYCDCEVLANVEEKFH